MILKHTSTPLTRLHRHTPPPSRHRTRSHSRLSHPRRNPSLQRHQRRPRPCACRAHAHHSSVNVRVGAGLARRRSGGHRRGRGGRGGHSVRAVAVPTLGAERAEAGVERQKARLDLARVRIALLELGLKLCAEKTGEREGEKRAKGARQERRSAYSEEGERSGRGVGEIKGIRATGGRREEGNASKGAAVLLGVGEGTYD